MERAMSWKRPLVAAMLAVCLTSPIVASFVGCDTANKTVIQPVKQVAEWIVSFAKETGEFIGRKATAFADAVAAAWRAFWGTDKINNVIVDKDNPQRGKYDGVLQCKAEWNRTVDSRQRHNELSIKLDHPRMVRKSAETTEWELAPEERARLNDLQKQMMSAT